YLATDYRKGELRLYRFPGSKSTLVLSKADDAPFAISPNGDLVLICDMDGRTQCFSVPSGEALWTLDLPPRTTSSLDRDQAIWDQAIDDSGRIAIVGCGQDLVVIALDEPRILHRLKHPHDVNHLLFLARDGEPLMAVS